MKDLGWVPGQNVVAERRYGESADQLRAAAADLVRLKVDVLVTPNASLARILQRETKTIPIVVQLAGGELVMGGLVASLARPGGNLTGVQVRNDELIPKKLEVLKALVPTLSRLAFLRDDVISTSSERMVALYDQEAAAAARSVGLDVHPVTVQRSEEFTAAFQSMTTNRDQGLLVMATLFSFLHRRDIVELAAKHRIIAIYENRGFVEAGGLVSYGANLEVLLRLSAVLVDKILRGAKPADLPVEQPTKFELVINLKTAKALGLTVPPSLLLRADEVIQ
jgi:putative ABC transport system substrate-binding protein